MATIDRYARQKKLPQVGEAGQRAIASSRAVLVGVGALGCAIADHLARAGVGTIVLIDRDCVESSNLQRQSLFTERDATQGLPKAQAAKTRLEAINSTITIVAHAADLTPRNALSLIEPEAHADAPGVTVLFDGTDNFQTRYLLNDIAVKYSLPFVYGGAVATHGMQMTILPGLTPCLRCLFPDMPTPGSQPTCDTAGVLGPVVAIVAACQAADGLRIMLGQAQAIQPTLLDFDLWLGSRQRFDLSHARADDCPCCGQHIFAYLQAANQEECTPLCGQKAMQVWPQAVGKAKGGSQTLDLASLAKRFQDAGLGDGLTVMPFLLRVELPAEQSESETALTLSVFADSRAIVSGTTDPQQARSVYARYIGM